MIDPRELLEYFIAINKISNDPDFNFDDRLQRILEIILKCLQVKNGSIMLRKGKKLEVIAASNPVIRGIQQSLDEDSVSSWVAKHQEPVLISNLDTDGRFVKQSGRYEKDAFLSVPIISNGETIGVLNVTDKIESSGFAIEEKQILLNVAGLVIDTLEKQKLIQMLQKKERTLQQKNRKLRKGEKLKTELFNMLIHDLKGPISETVANLDILTYTVDEENRDFVQSAQTGCFTLLRMVGNLLDIAKSEEGRLNLLYETINGRDLVKEAIARLFGLATIKEVQLAEDYPAKDSNGEFWADRGLLLRVLQNLLSNAIEHSPSHSTIKLGYCCPNSRVIEFFVTDEGSGIPAEYHKSIFDKYIQIEKKNDGRIYTTGLGLTFCKVAVHAHKGKIGLSSEAGKGSRFSFTLPLGVPAERRQ